jgi:hypothetical protein
MQPAEMWQQLHANCVVLIRAVVEQLNNATIMRFKKQLENKTGEPLQLSKHRRT